MKLHFAVRHFAERCWFQEAAATLGGVSFNGTTGGGSAMRMPSRQVAASSLSPVDT